MKTLLLAFALFTAGAFAFELTAREALLSTITAGEYNGITPEGDACAVSIRDLTSKVAIIASVNGLTKRSEVLAGAVYRANPGNRSFLATVLTTTLTGSRENIFRTIAVGERTQYVVVADLVIENRETFETKVECIIDL